MDKEENSVKRAIAENIPVIYMEPVIPIKQRKLAIFLSGLSGTKESLIPYLADIAERGYVALAFDNYEHGERGMESKEEISTRVFSNMRKYGWKILGKTALDTIKVIDWAIEYLNVLPEIYMGGISMGGDITITVAGIDSRLVRIAPIITTPDWMRPGMHEIGNSSKLMDPGVSDSDSQNIYDQLNPITHLKRYLNCPPMRATLGEVDTHIPSANLERFKRELKEISSDAANRIEIVYISDADHPDVMARRNEWWEEMLTWWLL
jgi:uncharacterized protein